MSQVFLEIQSEGKNKTFSVITVNDSVYSQSGRDDVGPFIVEYFRKQGLRLEEYIVLPEDEDIIFDYIMRLCDKNCSDLLLTDGGTGLSQRHIVPEVTRKALTRLAPGFSELIRMEGQKKNQDLVSYRGISGLRNSSIIINLPGRLEEVKESLKIISRPLIRSLRSLEKNNIIQV